MKLLKNETYIKFWKRVVTETKQYTIFITAEAVLIAIILIIWVIKKSAWPTWTGLTGKTAWDFASLLIVPLALAVIAYFFNKRQKGSELEIARKQRKQDLEIAQRQREQDLEIAKEEQELEREIAQDRVQETALQNYLDKMTELLLEPNNLRTSEEGSEVRSIARSRALTILGSLNAERKASVLRFLCESGLIDTRNTVIDLKEADLSEANLRKANLSEANLSGANLDRADLNFANLARTKLVEAELVGAKLVGANLVKADLSKADLGEAKLANANLGQAKLVGAKLDGANLTKADLARAKLADADLVGADLENANLGEADLEKAYLSSETSPFAFRTPKAERARFLAILHNHKVLEARSKNTINLVGATYNDATTWPPGFDPEAAGAVKVND